MGKQIELLKHHTDLFSHGIDGLDVITQGNAVDNNIALLVLFEAINASDKRRFARPRRPTNHKLFAFKNIEIDIPEHMELIPVPFIDLGKADDGLAHSN